MIEDPVTRAVAALRAFGHSIEPVIGMRDIYRVDEGGAATGADLVALAARLGLTGNKAEQR